MLLAFVHTASVAKLLKSRKWRCIFEKIDIRKHLKKPNSSWASRSLEKYGL